VCSSSIGRRSIHSIIRFFTKTKLTDVASKVNFTPVVCAQLFPTPGIKMLDIRAIFLRYGPLNVWALRNNHRSRIGPKAGFCKPLPEGQAVCSSTLTGNVFESALPKDCCRMKSPPSGIKAEQQ